jgi:hypothetical protein
MLLNPSRETTAPGSRAALNSRISTIFDSSLRFSEFYYALSMSSSPVVPLGLQVTLSRKGSRFTET